MKLGERVVAVYNLLPAGALGHVTHGCGLSLLTVTTRSPLLTAD